MTYDASNRKQVRKAEKASAIADRARVEVVASLMSTIAGRAYVHERLVSGHVFATSFSPDALTMAFSEGERNQGLQLLNDVMLHSPTNYTLMMSEANERHTSRERSRSTDSGGRGEGREPSVDGPDNWQSGDPDRDEAVH